MVVEPNKKNTTTIITTAETKLTITLSGSLTKQEEHYNALVVVSAVVFRGWMLVLLALVLAALLWALWERSA